MGNVGLFKEDYNKIFWVVYFGGFAILNRFEKRFDLWFEKLGVSRRVLADYGNVSSNIIVYVMEYMIEESLKMKKEYKSDDEWGLILVFGFGIIFEGIFVRNFIVLIN